ncbi:MAG: hypothetical protein ACWA5Q_07950 [bacterium]
MLPIAALLGFTVAVSSTPPAEDEWLKHVPDPPKIEVNEGELDFLTSEPEKPPHLHHHHLRISQSSLTDGWVSLFQCHQQMAVTGSAEIAFHPERSRNLKVTFTDNIGHTSVEGHSVQMEDIQHGAVLCLSLETHALHQQENAWVLRNGPFMRRFLDGYFPLLLTMTVDWRNTDLCLAQMTPTPQPGLDLYTINDFLRLEALFEGQLMTALEFVPGTQCHSAPATMPGKL